MGEECLGRVGDQFVQFVGETVKGFVLVIRHLALLLDGLRNPLSTGQKGKGIIVLLLQKQGCLTVLGKTLSKEYLNFSNFGKNYLTLLNIGGRPLMDCFGFVDRKPILNFLHCGKGVAHSEL